LLKSYDPKQGGGGAKPVEYLYDGLDPIAEYNTWNPQYSNYYRGDAERMVSRQNFPSGTQGQIYWFHYDGLGSVTGLTKQNGNSHHNYRYEPYGQLETPNGNFTDPHNHYTFTGQELDETMALYEFYARAYDYQTGTWLQQDVYRGELNAPKTLHRYGYVGNSPTNYRDWYGFKVYSCDFVGPLMPGDTRDCTDNPVVNAQNMMLSLANGINSMNQTKQQPSIYQSPFYSANLVSQNKVTTPQPSNKNEHHFEPQHKVKIENGRLIYEGLYWENSHETRDIGGGFESKNLSAGGGLKIDCGLSDCNMGLMGNLEIYKIENKDKTLIGDPNMGFTGNLSHAGPRAESFIGIKDSSVGFELEGSLLDAETGAGMNILGTNVSVNGKIMFEGGVGAGVGSKTEVTAGPFKLDVTLSETQEKRERTELERQWYEWENWFQSDDTQAGRSFTCIWSFRC